MQLHTLQPIHFSRSRKRVGRGGKRGGYSGRGIKGQKSRAGAKIRPMLRDILKKIPKRRGRSKHQFKSITTKPQVINVGELAAFFQARAAVSPATLVTAGAIERVRGRIPPIKILGEGELTIPLTVSGCKVSTSARGKIEAAGGSIALENFYPERSRGTKSKTRHN